MGLDSIEILVHVEKALGINIPDHEAEKIITVGDFHNTAWRHLEGRQSDKCNSQGVFYNLRQSLADSFKTLHQDIKLDTSLNDIFPQHDRRQVYLNFTNGSKFTLPGLALPGSWALFLNTIGVISILGGLAVSLILINFFDYSKWILFLPVIGSVLTLTVSKILEPKRTQIKPSTLKGFTEKVLELNYSTLVKQNGANRREVENIINQIIADVAGLEINEVTAEKKICDDLGID